MMHSARIILLLIVAGLFCLYPVSAQTTYEFSGTTYAYQKAHLDSSTNVIQNKLGIRMRTFGAPYNQIDATFLQVFSEDPVYRVLLLGELSPAPSTGQVNLSNRVFIESATGVPSFSYFLSSWYAKKATYTDYMVMQGHPFDWTTPAKMTEFSNILNYLIATDSVVFTTPYGYYRYLTDNTIPRTTKIQVILKLDDLRASSYFYPCLPTYDTLVAKKVKASFGVNKMETLNQSQIDTLKYYLRQTTAGGDTLFEIWNHGLDHSQTVVSAGGNWSDGSIWPGGTVPTAADDVTIPAGVTITLDIPDAVCGDLTVNGTLTALNTTAVGLTVQGNVLINSGGSFTAPALTGAVANIFHTLTVYGDFTNTGGTFDFRGGSAGTTLRAINTTFTGSVNSTVTVGTFSSSNNDFNSITINKSGGAKVILGSDVVCDQGSSNGVAQLILTSGIVQTGNYAIYALSTTATDLVGGSATSYINGALGRGMSNSVGKSNPFPVGDAAAYRPISVRTTNGGLQSGHHVIVRCIHGNANTGSSAFTGGIDTVSGVRYYQISYNKGTNASAASTMGFSQYSPSYGTDDGIAAGNTQLRVAYSTDNRATWKGMTQTTTHTTSLASPPTTITPTVTDTVTLTSGTGYIYCALANVTGPTSNPLPVELVSFSATPAHAMVTLRWSTASETRNAGFTVERRRNSGAEMWEAVGVVPGHGTTSVPNEYRFVDAGLTSGTYGYRLRQTDMDGRTTLYTVLDVTVDDVPRQFLLSGNYPNPFNPSTTITFTLPSDGHASLTIYNMLGQAVAQLADGPLKSGVLHSFQWNAGAFPSGIYFCRLSFEGRTLVQRMVLSK